MSVNRKISKRDIDKALIDKFTRSLEITENIRVSLINLINLNENPDLILRISKKLTTENKNHLLDIIYQSKQTSSINLASSNAMTLLNFSDYAFKDLDFSDTKIPYANLSFSQFINTSFENTDLSSTNFYKSHFFDCSFAGSDLSNTNFGISNIRDTELDSIYRFHYDDNRDLLVAGSKTNEKELQIWNINKKKQVFSWKWNIFDWIWEPCPKLLLIFSNKYLAVAGPDYKVIVWDMLYYTAIFEFYHKKHQFQAMALSPCDNFIASYSSDKNIYIHDIQSKNLLHVISMRPTRIRWMTWSPCSNYLATGSELIILTIWDVKTHTSLYQNESKSIRFNSITWVKNFLITVYDFKSILIWNFKLRENMCVINAHYQDLNVLSLSNNGKYLASSSNENYTKIWDISKQKVISKFYEKGNLIKMIFDRDWHVKSEHKDTNERRWELSKGYSEEMSWIEFPLLTGAFSPNKDIFASGFQDFYIKLWSVLNLTCLNTLKYHKSAVKTLRFSPCGDYLASGDESGLVVIYNINDNEITTDFDLEIPISSISFSPDGKSLLAKTADDCLHLYDLENKYPKTITNPNQDLLSLIEIAKWDPNLAESNFIAELDFFDYDGTEILDFGKDGHDKAIIFWSLDDKFITTSWNAQYISIYDVDTGLLFKKLDNQGDDLYLKTPKNKWFLASSCYDGTVRIRCLNNKQFLKMNNHGIKQNGDWDVLILSLIFKCKLRGVTEATYL